MYIFIIYYIIIVLYIMYNISIYTHTVCHSNPLSHCSIIFHRISLYSSVFHDEYIYISNLFFWVHTSISCYIPLHPSVSHCMSSYPIVGYISPNPYCHVNFAGYGSYICIYIIYIYLMYVLMLWTARDWSWLSPTCSWLSPFWWVKSILCQSIMKFVGGWITHQNIHPIYPSI